MTLDLEALRTFAVIVEQGSFAAAAEGVRRTQPAITQRIQKLEQSVGRPIFTKVGRSKRLTEDGLRLYEYARRLLALHDEACEALTSTPVTGNIRLGAPDDVTDTILPNLLARFSSLYPRVRIIIHVARSAFLMRALKQGDIDMTISTRDDTTHPRIVLRTVPTVWISGAYFRLDRSQPLPLVLHDEPSLFRTLALDALERAKIPYQINFISPALSGIRAAVSAGLGVTARSVEMLNPQFRALAEKEGLPRMPDVNFYLYLAGLNSNPIARQLFESYGR
jgi:DNA-binding transcriptional LysR family regulator